MEVCSWENPLQPVDFPLTLMNCRWAKFRRFDHGGFHGIVMGISHAIHQFVQSKAGHTMICHVHRDAKKNILYDGNSLWWLAEFFPESSMVGKPNLWPTILGAPEAMRSLTPTFPPHHTQSRRWLCLLAMKKWVLSGSEWDVTTPRMTQQKKWIEIVVNGLSSRWGLLYLPYIHFDGEDDHKVNPSWGFSCIFGPGPIAVPKIAVSREQNDEIWDVSDLFTLRDWNKQTDKAKYMQTACAWTSLLGFLFFTFLPLFLLCFFSLVCWFVFYYFVSFCAFFSVFF